MRRRSHGLVRTTLHELAWHGRSRKVDAAGGARSAFARNLEVAAWLRDTVLHRSPAGRSLEEADQLADGVVAVQGMAK